MRSPKSSNKPVRVRHVSPPQPAVTSSEYPRRGAIGRLSDEVLLNIFRYYLDTSPRFWPRLTHICRKWKHIVFASQRALRLRLFCTHGTPATKTLDCWPTLPIVVQYGGPPEPSPPATEDEDNTVAALRQSGRVSSISLILTNSLLEKLSAIDRPFSELEDLVLRSQTSVLLTLPRAFRWGLRLRTLHLTRATIPALPELLSLSEGLVDLQLHEIPQLGYLALNAFVDSLSGMTQLRSLSLSHHFLSFAFPRNYVRLPPQSGERVVLPALTCLKYRGTSEHLDRLVARIDAPRLGDIDIGFLGQPMMDVSQLSQFIDRIEMQKLHRRIAILSSEDTISISFTQPDSPSRLELQISCELLDLQLSYMAQICNGLSAFLIGVEHLHIGVRRTTSGQYDNQDEDWLELIQSFRGTKWLHIAGEHSTNIVFALQQSQVRGDTVLPALCKLCIREPEPHYTPLRDAVVSFIHSHQVSGHIIAVELCINKLLGTAGPLSQHVMIEMFSDDVLRNIFHHFIHTSPQFWYTLTHVCQKWRQIIFDSPQGLRLRLHCTYGTPVIKALGYWPPFPLVVNYGVIHRPPAPEDEDNIMAALEHTDRVCSISFTVSSSLLKKLSTISKPFLELEDLVLLSKDNSPFTLPSAFWWGHRLRTLHSTRVAFASLPQLLLPSQNLVDIQLDEIPGAGYFSPEAFANALCGMTQLQALSLHFLSYPPRRKFLSLPPSLGDRVVLPVLTRFRYRGTSKYLDSLVAKIDAPRLGDIDITFFSQPTLDALQLGLFINRIELWGSPPRVDILSSGDTISITLSQPGTRTRLGLQISCEQLDWQLSSISRICDNFSSFLFSVEDLRIETAGPSSAPDDTDDEQWLRLVRTFDGAKDFYLAGKLAAAILRALHLADEGHKNVLPALRNLHVRPTSVGAPLPDSVEAFVAKRRLSGHPVQVYYFPVPLGEPQNQTFHKNFVDMPLQQLTGFYTQLVRAVEEGERNLNAAGSAGSESEMQQRQALRARLDGQKQLLLNIRELINLKRQGGDPVPQAVNGAPWLEAAQRVGVYSAPERPPQHNIPLNPSVSQIPPQRNIPTPQQNFAPSVTAQSNLTQMSPHVSGNGLAFNGALAQIPGAQPQHPPQAPHPPPQQTIQCSRLPTLPEDRFKVLFAQFANTTGLRLNDRDFIIDNRAVNPWALHRAVFARNGFDSVTANNEWPVIGAALGFPPFSVDLAQPPRCAPATAHRLQQLYNDALRYFELAYVSNVFSQLRNSQAPSQISAQPPQQHPQPHQLTKANYQALLASIPQDSSAMTPEAHSAQLQRAAQDQNGFQTATGLTFKNVPLDSGAQINQAAAFQGHVPPQLIPNHMQLHLSRQGLTQALGKPNTLQPTQMNNSVCLLVQPPTVRSMGASSMSSMGTQITGAGSSGGAQSSSGSMSAPLTQVGTKRAPSSILTQSAGAVPTRRPTAEEVTFAKKWVEEQKRLAFNRSFDGVVSGSSVAESGIGEYTRHLERLDMVLMNIDKYIHIVFAALRKEDVVRRMFAMMASTKFQLEESKKPNPRYILELHTIRGMIQEACNMDKGLRVVLGFKVAAQENLPAPQQPQQPPSMGPSPSSAQPAPPAMPPVTVGTTVTTKETVSSAGPWRDDIDTHLATGSDNLYTDSTSSDS